MSKNLENGSHTEAPDNKITSTSEHLKRKTVITRCVDSATGEAFFKELAGSEVIDITVKRVKNNDLVVFGFSGGQQAIIVGEKDAFIAIEIKNPQPSETGNLSFRKDISHRRLNLKESMDIGADVIYKDPSLVKGETVTVSAEVELANLALKQSAVIESIKPTWWTEDWVTLNLEGDRKIIVRADNKTIKGAILVSSNDEVKVLNYGDNHINHSDYHKSGTSVPFKFLPKGKQS